MKKNDIIKKVRVTKKALKYLPTDTQFEEYILDKVSGCGDSWDIQVNEGSCLCIPKTGFIPKQNMKAKFYGKGFGYTVRGVVIEGTVIYYRTPDEAEQDHKAYCKKMDADRARSFKKNLKKMDAEYDALPDVFKQRIDKFRKANPNFRRDYEGYEMFTIKEAIKIANAIKDPDKIDEFYKKPFEEQVKIAGIDEGHSGNTFGCACNLALWYLKQPEMVVKTHGALAPLVGCKEYGCPH